ncbi:MAG: hypothetical protein KF830_17355, partial [Planctomycetes bacterium]|nr:hypothetical protein [Planctomycetota bacterium]
MTCTRALLSLAAALLPLAACRGPEAMPVSITSDLASEARLQRVLASLAPKARWSGSPMQMAERHADSAGLLVKGRFVHGLTGTLRSTVDIAALHAAILADAEEALSAAGASSHESASSPVFSGQPMASPALACTTVIVYPRSGFQGQWT